MYFVLKIYKPIEYNIIVYVQALFLGFDNFTSNSFEVLKKKKLHLRFPKQQMNYTICSRGSEQMAPELQVSRLLEKSRVAFERFK
jgi:hypothetical protein